MLTASVYRREPNGPDARLLGEWRLIYASSGLAVGSAQPSSSLLAQALAILERLPGVGMAAVWQQLSRDGSGTLDLSGPWMPQGIAPGSTSSVVATVNSAEFSFGPLGRWRISVDGRWLDMGDGVSAHAWFECFRLRPLEVMGLPLSALPEVSVPVPQLLRATDEWATTYLDGNLRVGRSSQGGVFLFQRASA